MNLTCYFFQSGNRISLISKKNIRYEGILYSINEADSTLALQNVRSYGTEGREKVDSSNYIGPQDAVHPYLLFRGCDIKDLHVHENKAKPEETANTPVAKMAKETKATVSDGEKKEPLLDSSATDNKIGSGGRDPPKAAKPERGSGGNNSSNNSKKYRKPNQAHQVGTGASLLTRKARGSVNAGAYSVQELIYFSRDLNP